MGLSRCCRHHALQHDKVHARPDRGSSVQCHWGNAICERWLVMSACCRASIDPDCDLASYCCSSAALATASTRQRRVTVPAMAVAQFSPRSGTTTTHGVPSPASITRRSTLRLGRRAQRPRMPLATLSAQLVASGRLEVLQPPERLVTVPEQRVCKIHQCKSLLEQNRVRHLRAFQSACFSDSRSVQVAYATRIHAPASYCNIFRIALASAVLS